MHHRKSTLMIQSEQKLSNNLIVLLGKMKISFFKIYSFCFSSEIFFEAEKHIIELMKKNSYPRFLQSEQYRNLLQNAPNPIAKKA